jgi:hypothetical protein
VSARKKTIGIPRAVLMAVALILPAASLIPLGSLWLWQNGLILYWALFSCVVVSGIYYLERRLLAPPAALLWRTTPAGRPALVSAPDARADGALAADVKADRLSSRDAVVNLGLETIEVVAKRLHPERADPLLQFTVPEALAVIEQASAGLRDFVSGSFPLGDRVTVAQLMWLYRWRGVLGMVEKGYDLWRIVRMLNPVSAATQELQGRFPPDLRRRPRAPCSAPRAHSCARWGARRSICTAATCASQPIAWVRTPRRRPGAT